MINPNLVYGPTAALTARALLDAGAYLVGPDFSEAQFYKWRSGIRAPVYCDCRVLQGHPGPSRTVVAALAACIENNWPHVDAVVGMAEAGLFWSAPVALELARPHAFVRKQPKEHGRSGLVAGAVLDGCQKVVLVDDLMAGGVTVAKAVAALAEETDCDVVGVQTIVNWDFPSMRVLMTHAGVDLKALVSFPQLLTAAVDRGTLTRRAARELNAFYRNPHHHKWDRAALTGPDDGADDEITSEIA